MRLDLGLGASAGVAGSASALGFELSGFEFSGSFFKMRFFTLTGWGADSFELPPRICPIVSVTN